MYCNAASQVSCRNRFNMWPRLCLISGKVCHTNELNVMVDMKIGHVDTEQKDEMKERKKRRGRKGGCPHSPRDRTKLWDS